MNSSIPIIIAVLSVSISLVSGLKCYSCESRENDEACGTISSETDRKTCDVNEFCIVKRTERSDSTGRDVTILRGCGLSASVSAVNAGGYQVDISVSSQLCSTDLCNTGNGLQQIGNLLFPEIDISSLDNNGVGFNFGVWNDFKKVFNQAFSQSGSVAPAGKKIVLKDLNVPTSLKMFGVVPHQVPSFTQPQPSNDDDNKNFVAAGSDKKRSAPIAWLRVPEFRNNQNPLQQRFNVAQ